MNQQLAKQQFIQNRQFELTMMQSAIHSNEELIAAATISHKRSNSNATALLNHHN